MVGCCYGTRSRCQLKVGGGSLLLIDESYNANPASMRAALAVLGAAAPGPKGRRVAVLGDMLELGPQGPGMHAALAQDVLAYSVDLVFTAGPLMKKLHDALPGERRGHWEPRAAGLEAPLNAALRAGDVVMIKGSNGSRMGPLVAALQQHFAAA